MTDANSGWLFGDRFLWTTNDGGITWRELPFPVLRPGDFARGEFVNKLQGWLLSQTQRLYETRDGGLQWTPQSLPESDGIIQAAWMSGDSSRAWLGGGEYRPSAGPDGPNYAIRRYESGGWGRLNPVVFRRTGIGATWNKQLLPRCSWSIFHLQFWDSQKGVAVGDNGCVYLTETGGDQWTLGTLHSKSELAGREDDDGVPTIFLPSRDAKGWLSTRNGFYETNDGGKNWYEISASGTPHFDVFGFSDAANGLAIARQSEIYESIDGGRTWKRLMLDMAPRYLYFLEKRRGWLLSDSGLYRVIQ
jgi:photosystem II stability/assembly factor-like uncharacterized protein